MGRLALMLVVGLTFEFGILANGLQHSFNNLAISEVGYYKYSCARNLARTAIHATLRVRPERIGYSDERIVQRRDIRRCRRFVRGYAANNVGGILQRFELYDECETSPHNETVPDDLRCDRDPGNAGELQYVRPFDD